MPNWAGKWEGGRYYLDSSGRQVFFIERKGRSLKLATHDETHAVGQLALYLENPVKFSRQLLDDAPEAPQAVFITTERVNLYMQSIRDCVEDHRNARRSYIMDWADKGLDLLHVDKRQLREVLASWDGGHRGRVETLNAFCNFLVEEEDLPSWKRFVNPFDPKSTRAARVIYSIEHLRAKLATLEAGLVRDVFYLRAATGMHQTEIDQIKGAKVFNGPLPDDGKGIRLLDGTHEIKGVVQVKHKNGQRHRVSLDQAALDAVLRLRADVPSRVTVWKKLEPEIIPSNLRHTYVTLMGEIGKLVEYKEGGLSRAQVAQLVGHRAGSTMTADRYENMQVPPMALLPLEVANG